MKPKLKPRDEVRVVGASTKLGRSGLSRVTPQSKTSQSLGLILKGRDNFWHVDHPQHSPHPTTRTEQFQATALTPEETYVPVMALTPELSNCVTSARFSKSF